MYKAKVHKVKGCLPFTIINGITQPIRSRQQSIWNVVKAVIRTTRLICTDLDSWIMRQYFAPQKFEALTSCYQLSVNTCFFYIGTWCNTRIPAAFCYFLFQQRTYISASFSLIHACCIAVSFVVYFVSVLAAVKMRFRAEWFGCEIDVSQLRSTDRLCVGFPKRSPKIACSEGAWMPPAITIRFRGAATVAVAAAAAAAALEYDAVKEPNGVWSYRHALPIVSNNYGLIK